MDKTKFKEQLLKKLYEPYKNCMMCPLGKTRPNNVVFGEGNPNSEIVFIGEAPGQEEDIQGRPFVGRSGKLLTKVMEIAGMKREDAFITNVVKCRPPGNRLPTAQESSICTQILLEKQLQIINPKIVCTLGSCALNYIAMHHIHSDFKITEMHGRPITLPNYILIPLYHPAYILRNNSKLDEFVNDMIAVKEILRKLKK